MVEMQDQKTDVKTYNLYFKGFWIEGKTEGVQDDPGIFLVYSCKLDEKENRVGIREMLYIGKAANIKDGINDKLLINDLRSSLLSEEKLCFAYAIAPFEELSKIQTILAIIQDTPYNLETDTSSFKDDKFIFHIEGTCPRMKYKDFIINK